MSKYNRVIQINRRMAQAQTLGILLYHKIGCTCKLHFFKGNINLDSADKILNLFYQRIKYLELKKKSTNLKIIISKSLKALCMCKQIFQRNRTILVLNKQLSI